MKLFKNTDINFMAVYFAVMAIIYIVSRYCLGMIYTPEWVARHLFIYVFIILTIAAVKGCKRFVCVAVTGYIAAVAAGEIFGGFESNVPPQFLHWGWLIFIVVFIVFCIVGIILEKRRQRE